MTGSWLVVCVVVDAKQLSKEMGVIPRTFRRLWKKLKVPPTFRAQAPNLWSRADADLLLKRYGKHPEKPR